jgi:glyoxylase-like metal-dependent hydrolase (beta-lactamase superfamily II)
MTDPIVPDELAERFKRGERPYLLDVRRAEDFADWRIEGAENLPIYDDLLDREFDGLAAALDDLPEDEEIVTVCVAGVTSQYAAESLSDRGFDARSLDGGMRAWGQVYVPYDTDVAGVTQVVRPGTGCVSSLVEDGDEAVLVDPGMHVDRYLALADDRGVDVVGAVDTHAHADHVSGGPRLARDLDVPYYLHEADSGSLDAFEPLANGDTVAVGDREFAVVHTPGHTPGSVSLRWGEALLTGDTLFLRGVGRPDLEGDDEAAVRRAADRLYDSIDRLLGFDGDSVVLPGHFSAESERPLAATLAAVEADNDLVGLDDREAFVDRVVSGLSATPANYQRIKQINRGREPLDEGAAELELGPNNCAAN